MGQEDEAAAGRAVDSAGRRAGWVLLDLELNTGQLLATAAAQAPRISHCLTALS